MAFEKDPNEVGCFWLKTGGRGEYMTGDIAGVGPVVCFPVKSDNPKAPRWRVLKSKPRDAAPSHDVDRVPPPTDDDLVF